MARPFNKIRAELQLLDIGQNEAAREIHMEGPAFSRRMNGRIPWKLDEMYAVMDLIQQPYHKLHEYFPKDGNNEPGVSRKKGAA